MILRRVIVIEVARPQAATVKAPSVLRVTPSGRPCTARMAVQEIFGINQHIYVFAWEP